MAGNIYHCCYPPVVYLDRKNRENMNTKKHLQTILPRVKYLWVHLSGFLKKRPKTAFIIKFFIFSILFFIIWTQIGRYYVVGISQVSKVILGGMGYDVTLHHNGDTYFMYRNAPVWLTNTELINFNIASFLALILATPRISKQRILKSLAVGIPILFVFHVINLVYQFPYIDYLYYDGPAWARVIKTFFGVANMALPFILWIALTYDFILETFIPKEKLYHCPLCGETKKGILEHITDVHPHMNKKERHKVDRYIDNHPTLKRKKHT